MVAELVGGGLLLDDQYGEHPHLETLVAASEVTGSVQQRHSTPVPSLLHLLPSPAPLLPSSRKSSTSHSMGTANKSAPPPFGRNSTL